MSIEEGIFDRIPAFVQAADHAIKNNSCLHLMGLASSGNVHSSIEHLYALMIFARQKGIQADRIKIHAFTDGRDTSPTSGVTFLGQIEEKIKEIGVGQIASISGRYYAMDRDNRWDRIEKAYLALTKGEGPKVHSTVTALNEYYKTGITDEFVVPTLVADDSGAPIGLIKENDAVIFFNYRTDRPRELTKAFVQDPFGTPEVPGFNRDQKIKNLFFVTMTEYERYIPVSGVAFPQDAIHMPLARILSNHGKRHLHMAESEKERFTTFFFNGIREDPFPGEEKIFIPSPKVPTYDLKPEMSSYEITEAYLKKLNARTFDFCVINFACADMVGHTGNLQATIKACQALDLCLLKIVNATVGSGGAVVITADHGNAEQMIDANGNPETEHSNNPVPFVICGEGLKSQPMQFGILADVAPTILALMNIPKPTEMTGRNLLPL